MTVLVVPVEAPTTPTTPEPVARPELDAVLREINRIRRERGGDALYELPKGAQGDGRACVVARAIGAGFCLTSCAWWDEKDFDAGRTADIRLPRAVEEFVGRFDHGEYPELIAP